MLETLNAATGEVSHGWDLENVNVLLDGIALGPDALYLICDDGTVICFDGEKVASKPGAGFTAAKKGDRDLLQRAKPKAEGPRTACASCAALAWTRCRPPDAARPAVEGTTAVQGLRRQ